MIRDAYLIQRGKTKDVQDIESARTGEFVDLDYMGAAEFEFGAFPLFQREIGKELKNLEIHSLGLVNGREYWFLSRSDEAKDYATMLVSLIKGKIRTKCRTGIDDRKIIYVKKGEQQQPIFDSPDAPFEFNVWFDLTNKRVFASSEEVLKNLLKTIPNSIKYMDEKKGA